MLKVEHLSYEIEEDGKKQEILKDVSFEVKDGEMLVVTGPNGGGKSTIAKLMMGLYKRPKGRSGWTGRTLRVFRFMSVRKLELVLRFSSRPGLKE